MVGKGNVFLALGESGLTGKMPARGGTRGLEWWLCHSRLSCVGSGYLASPHPPLLGSTPEALCMLVSDGDLQGRRGPGTVRRDSPASTAGQGAGGRLDRLTLGIFRAARTRSQDSRAPAAAWVLDAAQRQRQSPVSCHLASGREQVGSRSQ